MKALLLLVAALPVAAQTVAWDVGTTSPVQGFLPDPCTGGSTQIPSANLGTLAGYSAEYQTMRWGSPISCQLFGISGPGTLNIEYEEPSVTAPGLRAMTFSINYVSQPPVDIFAKCGASVPCSTTVHTTGPVLLTCTANSALNKPNCIIMGLKWVPDQLRLSDWSQVPGTTDGVSATFNLQAAPNPSSSLTLVRNGIVQTDGVDYTISGSVITFKPGAIPIAGDLLVASYRY